MKSPHPGQAQPACAAASSSARGRFAVSAWPAKIAEWIRHHTGSLMATGVDFLVMITTVELLGLGPVAGTAAGALCGAFTSFLLGRNWVFRRADSSAGGQMVRYALVAGTSLGLNALGEYLTVRAGLGYVRARVIVAVVVSNLWNYPMHKFFVFGKASQAKQRAS